MENCKRNDRVANEGSSVLLDINDGDRLVFARLSNAGTLKIGKKDCSLQPLIGCSFGSMFRVESGKDGLYLSPVSQYEEGNDTCDRDDIKVEEELKDNRALCDNNTAQNLTGEDIDTMRREGVTGDEIVEALIANSATFEKKTAFSQEKYRLRKQKKYAPKVLMRRPFARSICEAYFKKHPTRIGFLRMDTLSLLLSTANVTAFSDILVFDMVGGLVTGAVAERMGGSGYICNTYLGNSAHGMDIVRIFNFTAQTCRRILRCSLDDLCSAHNVTCEQVSQSEETAILETGANEQPSLHESSNEVQNTEEDMLTPETRMLETPEGDDAVPVQKAPKSAKAGEKASEELIKCWMEKGFSSLIVAAPDLDPWIIVQKLLPLLSYSAPFVIYHQYLQPLATCMHNLQIEKMAIGLQISEPWLREYQVLPSRTHPCMQMSAFGGYILSGTKICGARPAHL